MKLIDLMESPKGTTLYERLVSNPEFQEWFRGSKIVDEAGDPVTGLLKMYPYDGAIYKNKYEGRDSFLHNLRHAPGPSGVFFP